MVECTQYTLNFEVSREFISDEGGASPNPNPNADPSPTPDP